MRKLIVLLLLVLLIVLGCVYAFIPSRLPLKETISAKTNAKAFSRTLFNETTWKQWWPGQTNDRSSTVFMYNGSRYTLARKTFSSLVISIQRGTDSLSTELVLIPVQPDSVELNWIGMMETSVSPLRRWQKKSWAKHLTNDLRFLLSRMRAYSVDPDNLYGIRIREEKVVDSTLIFTSTTFSSYPTSKNIYQLIDKLRRFAATGNAHQTGSPMLNMLPYGKDSYLVRVALPVDKKLKDEGDIRYKWMLGGGKILVAEVRGGPAQIEKAFLAMGQFVDDHQRTAPAIPFQSLVTDRRNEPDTSKWVTKLYWPVM